MPEKRKLVEACRKVYEKGFVSAYDGNLSLRVSENTFFITRSGVCKGDVTVDDILEIDSSGNIISGEGKVSTEFKIHIFAYEHRPEVNSVVHCHPPYSTAFASTGRGLTENIFPEVILTIGKVPLCRYETPSTEALPLSMKPYIDFAWAILLENHGAVTLGKSIDEAYFKMEKLEHSARILFLAEGLGGAKPLPQEKVRELMDISKSTYGLQQDIRNVF